MQQRVATLQAGHVTTGIDAGLRGGHSTDGESYITGPCSEYLQPWPFVHTVLQEASLYQAREEYTTLCDRMKLVRR